MYQIPFLPNGSVPHFAGYWMQNIIWKDPGEFSDTVKILGYYRGRSATGLEIEMSTGGKCAMFISDIADMLQKAEVKDGKVSGVWTFKKRGGNYGIVWLRQTG